MVDRDGHLARLDDRLERVGVLRDDLQLERGLAVVGAEARRRVRHRGLGRLAHDPRAEPLQRLLQRREVLDRHHLAVADDHVGRAGDDRLDELEDVRPVVLVVGVGVDDHVGAELERRVQARLEAVRQPLVVGQPDDVVDAVGDRDLDGAIGRAVVDDEPLDGVETGDLTGQVGQRPRERLLLVETWDLDDQLHVNDERRYRARQTVWLAWRAQRSPGHAREPTPHALNRVPVSAATAWPRSSSRCSAWALRSGSSSSRHTRSTTPITPCCGGATCCTGTRWSSTASATRPSTRSRSPPARSCSSSAAWGTACGWR